MKEGTTLDEFCSNVGFGSVCAPASVSTSTSGGKLISNGVNHYRDFTPPVPPSPALSSKSKNKSGTLPNGNNGVYSDQPKNGGHRYGPPLSYHRSPRTTTLGPRVPVPYNYEDDLCHYTTINDRDQSTLTYSNKLRFNPKMQLVLDNESDSNYRQHPPPQGPAPPPLILHYEYDYPEYRRAHASQQRLKQVPSVLV